jgi:mercuric ion transport protein
VTNEKVFKTGIWGTIVTAICCFTPVLPWVLGLIGLAILIPYLDYVLFPLLFLFLALAFWGWRRARHTSERGARVGRP